MRFTLPFNLCRTRSRELTPVRTAAELKAITGAVVSTGAGIVAIGAAEDTAEDTTVGVDSTSAASANTDLLAFNTNSVGAATPKDRFGAEDE